MSARLLFVSHCPSENTAELRDAAIAGIDSLQLTGLTLHVKPPLETNAEDVADCDGPIIGSTENFGYMAGLIKDFFERIYYPCLDTQQGLPLALYIRAGEDGRGAKASIEKIVTGLRWKLIGETMILRGAYTTDFANQVAELAMTMAAGLDADIF